MKKIILINILLTLLFISCSPAVVEYTPAVVYLKSPEIVNIDGNSKTYFEFAVSDLNELEGSVEIVVVDKAGNKVLEKKMDKLLFSTDGTVVSFYSDELTISGKLDFEFKTCNVEEFCRNQSFKDIEIITNPETDKVNIEGKVYSDDNSHKVSIFLSSVNNKIIPDDDGNFVINDIDSGKYGLYTKGEDFEEGFYRYIYLKFITFNKSTKIYLYIPIDENQEYDEPLINCSYSSGDKSLLFFMVFLILVLVIYKKNNWSKV